MANPAPTWFPGLGEMLGSGVDGAVYALSDSDSVVKFCDAFDQALLTEIVAGYHPQYVKVLDFGIGEDGTHFIVMERLLSLSEDEGKVFHSLLSHEDKNAVKKRLSDPELMNVLAGLAKGLEFNADDVAIFYHQVVFGVMTHNDLHTRNIMKTSCGEFKLIDLNRISKDTT
jgi:hypothetical protein